MIGSMIQPKGWTQLTVGTMAFAGTNRMYVILLCFSKCLKYVTLHSIFSGPIGQERGLETWHFLPQRPSGIYTKLKTSLFVWSGKSRAILPSDWLSMTVCLMRAKMESILTAVMAV